MRQERRLEIITCMIETIERHTDLENIYSDGDAISVPVEDMYLLREDIIYDNHTDTEHSPK